MSSRERKRAWGCLNFKLNKDKTLIVINDYQPAVHFSATIKWVVMVYKKILVEIKIILPCNCMFVKGTENSFNSWINCCTCSHTESYALHEELDSASSKWDQYSLSLSCCMFINTIKIWFYITLLLKVNN